MELYDFHARQYDPQVGRFWGVDPMNQFPSGYTGMGNDPANLIDPTGMVAGSGGGTAPYNAFDVTPVFEAATFEGLRNPFDNMSFAPQEEKKPKSDKGGGGSQEATKPPASASGQGEGNQAVPSVANTQSKGDYGLMAMANTAAPNDQITESSQTDQPDPAPPVEEDGGGNGDAGKKPEGQKNEPAKPEAPTLKFIGMRTGFIPEFESKYMSGGITLGPFVLYETGLSKDPRYKNHEPGHVLQYYLFTLSPLGRFSYYQYIALPSLLTAPMNSAQSLPWERSASLLWNWLTGEKDPDLNRKSNAK